VQDNIDYLYVVMIIREKHNDENARKR